jgi:peptide/nickel transport system substrate-binding protein
MSTISRRQFLVLSTAAAAGVVVTACAPAATPAPEATKASEATAAPAATAAPEATKAPDATAAPAATAVPEVKRTWPLGDVPREKTLIYYWNAAPATGAVNPYAGAYNHQNGSACLYEPAAYYSAHGDKTYDWLAESHKYNADATELTITFRKGIKWSDGEAFTAKDPEFCMKMLKDNDGLKNQFFYKSEMKDVTAVDDVTLKITFNQSDYRFFFKSLTFRFDLGDDTAIQPMHYWKDVAKDQIISANVYDMAKGLPISTGPYGLGESTDQITHYDLRPTWWAVDTGFVEKYPDVERITMTLFTNDTLAAQKLINNEIDQPLDLRPLVVASLLNQAPDHVTTWTGSKPPYGYTDWWPISIVFNTMAKPWDNKDVRWAVAYAVDQQQIVDVAWGGAGKVANSPFPEFKNLNKYMAGIKDLTDKYNVLEVNPDKVTALMTKAGFTKNKDGMWADATGAIPDANLWAGVPLFGDIAPVIAEQLKAAGFACEHKAPNDVWTAKTDGRAKLFLFGHGGATIDPLDTFNLYLKENIKPIGTNSGGNLPRWSNDAFRAITDEMSKTAMDDPKMTQLFHDGMAIWYDELPDCPIVQWFHRVPVNTTYWENWPNAENPYMNSALWHLTMAQVLYGLKAKKA